MNFVSPSEFVGLGTTGVQPQYLEDLEIFNLCRYINSPQISQIPSTTAPLECVNRLNISIISISPALTPLATWKHG